MTNFSDPHPPTRRVGGQRLLMMPLLNLFAPGLAQLKFGFKILGIVALSISVMSWALLIALAALALTNTNKLIEIATGPNYLLALLWCCAIWLFVSIAVWVASLYSLKKSPVNPRQKTLLVILSTVVVLIQIFASAWAFSVVQAQQQLLSAVFTDTKTTQITSSNSEENISQPSNLTLVNGRVNILLLGGDAGAGRWGLRPDSISVVSINAETGDTSIIGVPRNLQNAQFIASSPLYGPFPNGYDCGQACLISYLYTYGAGHPGLYPDSANAGISAMQDAVQGSVGIEIPYVVLIDMAGFSSLVDSLGGVNVCIPQETLAQDMTTVFSAGCQHLNGQQALLYSRTRYDSNDYGRMAKQRLVQQALLDQLQPLNVLMKFKEIASRGGEYISTNIPQDQVAAFVELGLKMKGKPATAVELVPPVIDVTAPDFSTINQLVTEALK